MSGYISTSQTELVSFGSLVGYTDSIIVMNAYNSTIAGPVISSIDNT